VIRWNSFELASSRKHSLQRPQTDCENDRTSSQQINGFDVHLTVIANDGSPVREVPLVLGGTMKPYRWSIDGQYYPKADTITIRVGESVRFVFRNPTGMDHPFHLHGHSFSTILTIRPNLPSDEGFPAE
jgi:FtsP/CotA-like multicopper oxidase with cupredoxin domain